MDERIFLASEVPSSATGTHEDGGLKNMVSPGELITADTGFMRGHGTYQEEDQLYASVAGVRERVNKLLCVKPVKSRYNGEVGDVVVGRITEVGGKRWKVETNSRLDSVLHLAGVNLPGGELAEVQSVHKDGSMALHTRSLKYGKLAQGVLVKVWASLVKRRKSHFHNLPCGASIILGNNGHIWISPPVKEDEENTGGFIQNLDPVILEERSVIARLRNCIALLAEARIMLFDTSIITAFDLSLSYQIKDLLRPDVAAELSKNVRSKLIQEDTYS